MVRSDFLFPDATFMEGAGSALDLFGLLAQYNVWDTDQDADLAALRADWAAVGDFLWQALLDASREGNGRATVASSGRR